METLDDVVHEIVHGAVSLDVRSQGRLRLIRAVHPPHLDRDEVAAAVDAALLARGIGHVTVAWTTDLRGARVLGGVTEDAHRG